MAGRFMTELANYLYCSNSSCQIDTIIIAHRGEVTVRLRCERQETAGNNIFCGEAGEGRLSGGGRQGGRGGGGGAAVSQFTQISFCL